MPSPAASVATRYCAPPLLAGPAEELHLLFAHAVVHAAVEGGHAVGEAHRLQAPRQPFERVAVLREHDQLVLAEAGIDQDLAELLELGFVAGRQHRPGQLDEPLDLSPLCFQLRQ